LGTKLNVPLHQLPSQLFPGHCHMDEIIFIQQFPFTSLFSAVYVLAFIFQYTANWTK